MALTYGTQMARLRGGDLADLPAAADVHGRVRLFNEEVMLAGQAIGDRIEVARLPRGARFLRLELNADAGLGAATLACGDFADPARFAAAANLSADAPTPRAKAAVAGIALAEETILLLTVADAALPASGRLSVQTYYTLD
jgi:hypothetical protein